MDQGPPHTQYRMSSSRTCISLDKRPAHWVYKKAASLIIA
jgi:hypothetical protein